MSRLIDAVELLKDPYFMDETIPERMMFIEAVEDSPTAYDVEAVVRELEAKSTFYAHEAEGDKDMGYEYLTIRKYGISDGLDIAIEIVKRGGRNEQMR